MGAMRKRTNSRLKPDSGFHNDVAIAIEEIDFERLSHSFVLIGLENARFWKTINEKRARLLRYTEKNLIPASYQT